MGDKSAISWTDASWNPVTGCSHVSPGCHHCYAETLSLRHKWSDKPWTVENAAENVVLHPDRLALPGRWQKPRRIFVNSMSDLFHEQVPDEFIYQVFEIMARTPEHTYQVLTKRAHRLRDFCVEYDKMSRVLTNVWLGVTVESADYLWRLNYLVETPAAVRIVSFEPLIGDVGPLGKWLAPDCPTCHGNISVPPWGGGPGGAPCPTCLHEPNGQGRSPSLIHWAIIGGESGPGYRPMDLDWARSIKRQCDDAGVKVWFKQAGGPRPGMGADALGAVYQQFPEVGA